MSRTPYPDLLRRQVLRLWREGYSQNEIGEKTGMTRSAVSAFVFKLRRRGYSLPTRPRGLTSRLARKQLAKQFVENALLLYWHESRGHPPLAEGVRNGAVVSGSDQGPVAGNGGRVWAIPAGVEVRPPWTPRDQGSGQRIHVHADAD